MMKLDEWFRCREDFSGEYTTVFFTLDCKDKKDNTKYISGHL